MLFDARDTIASIPAAEVPGWVSVDDTLIKIDCFLATLIVYDSGECTIRVRHTFLTVASKSSQSTKRFHDSLPTTPIVSNNVRSDISG